MWNSSAESLLFEFEQLKVIFLHFAWSLDQKGILGIFQVFNTINYD
jgi:hypothetical protein